MGFVNLDNTTTDLAYLIDLLTTFADDGTDHIVGDVDLLSHGCSSNAAVHWLGRRTSVRVGTTDMGRMVGRHMRRSTVASSGLRCIVHRYGRVGLRSSCVVRVGLLGVRGRRQVVSTGVRSSPVVLTVAEVAASWLRAIRNNLHTAGYNAGRTTTSSSISRSCRASESLVKLLEKSATDIISRNMDSISYAHDHQRPFTRQGKAGVRSIQSCTRGLLDLAYTSTTLSDDGSNEDMGDEKSKRISLGLRVRLLG